MLKLLIGNKNYSTWSLRPWLLLSHAQIPFEEECLSFNSPGFKATVGRHSPVGKVPVLIHDDLVIWDSLAIAEYVAELFAEKQLWPEHRTSRAHARSICAEMHSSFTAMRGAMPMNCSHSFENVLFPLSVQNDVQRIVDIWEDCRNRYADEGFSASRFRSYTSLPYKAKPCSFSQIRGVLRQKRPCARLLVPLPNRQTAGQVGLCPRASLENPFD